MEESKQRTDQNICNLTRFPIITQFWSHFVYLKGNAIRPDRIRRQTLLHASVGRSTGELVSHELDVAVISLSLGFTMALNKYKRLRTLFTNALKNVEFKTSSSRLLMRLPGEAALAHDLIVVLTYQCLQFSATQVVKEHQPVSKVRV